MSLITVGVDDGFFPHEFKELRLKTILVGVLCVGKTPRSVKINTVTVDGSDGTLKTREVVEELMNEVGVPSINAIFLDGVTIAGFNYVNPIELHEHLRTPVIVIFKTELKLDRIRRALVKHFSDWRARYEVIEENYVRSQEVLTLKKRLRVVSYGLNLSEVSRLVSALQCMSASPEPLRIADLVASELTRETTLLEILRVHA